MRRNHNSLFRKIQQTSEAKIHELDKNRQERVGGIEPPSPPWKGGVGPFNYTREKADVEPISDLRSDIPSLT